MNDLSTRQSGLPATDYYAPSFRLEVEGVELDPASKGDVLELRVVMDMENMTSCELSINNWDAKNFTFKYSDTRTFDLGNRVHVRLGYADELRSMMRGQISTLAPRFPESGPPTLAVTVLDGMLRLRDRKPKQGEARKYTEMRDWQIAQQVAQRNGLRANVTQEGEVHAEVVQKNQDDASFLMERAKRIDFDVFIQTDPESGEDVLNFVRPTDARDGSPTNIYVLEWGKSLINFTPTLTLSRQVSKVTVRGWDPQNKAAIVYTATASDLPGAAGAGGGSTGPKVVEDKLGDKQEVVVDSPVASEQEARDLAISLLRERAYEFITGSGEIIGLPDLRPGDNVELGGLGQRFSGLYYVKKVEHRLGSGGYQTRFDVRQWYDGGTQS